ncbi:MAG: LexA family protein [Marinilabiliaceae bacterium]
MKNIEILSAETDSELNLDFADAGIHAGFPSPAQDYMETGLDLNKALIRHKASTFYGRVVGDSMHDAGIDEGDIIVIDKSLDARNGDLVVCYIDGEFAIKYLKMEDGRLRLYPANKKYAPIEVTNAEGFRVWGVVTYTIKKRNSRI